MKKLGEPVNLPKEYAGFSIRYVRKNGNAYGAKDNIVDRIQPFTLWCGDEVLYFTDNLADAIQHIAEEKKNGRN